jgi:Predicted ATPase
VIASVAFRNFKALRNASVRLEPFNLILGPNGSGKTSLIESLLHLRTLARLSATDVPPPTSPDGNPDMTFRFRPPHDAIEVRLSCVDATACNALHVSPPNAPGWPALRDQIVRIRSFVFDHEAMAKPSALSKGQELTGNGANLGAMLAHWRQNHPDAYDAFVAEALRLFPEYSAFSLESHPDGSVSPAFTLLGDVGVVNAANLSQGTLHVLGVIALTLSPEPPSVICIEEIDRGVHPRMLREVRDAFYRLAYPESFGLTRAPVQVIATTHSPYLLDLFREHPEEVILTQKRGREAHFERLSDRTDLTELLEGGSLGDLWFSGILGGVPEERT